MLAAWMCSRLRKWGARDVHDNLTSAKAKVLGGEVRVPVLLRHCQG